MITRLLLVTLLSALFMLPEASAQEPSIAAEATATKPLRKGQNVPEVTIKDKNGKEASLASLHHKQPLVIAFFRGSWCPICTKHMQQLIKVYPQVKEQGFEMIGISPDSVESTQANIDQSSIPFPLYSDSELNAAKGFGLAFKVDDATVTKYKGFGIDLEKASGQSHHALPIPAIYVVSQDGVIQFAHSNPDYRQRFAATDLLKEISK